MLARRLACQAIRRPPLLPRSRLQSTATTSTTSAAKSAATTSTVSAAATAAVPPAGGSSSSFAAHVLDLVWPERWRLAGGFALLSASSVISLVFPKAVGEAMDVCLAGDGFWTPARVAGALFALFTAQSVMIAGRSLTLTSAGEAISASLRRRTFDSLLRQELAFFDVTRSGELLSRLSADTQALQKVATTHAVAAARGSIMMVGCVGMMFKLSPALCAVGLAAFPAASLLSQWSGRRIKERQQLVQQRLADASAEAERAISNVRTLRLFSGETAAGATYDVRVSEAEREAVHVAGVSALMEAGVSLALNASLLAVLAVGGQQVVDGSLSYGDMSAFLLYTVFLGFHAGNLSTTYAELKRAPPGGYAPPCRCLCPLPLVIAGTPSSSAPSARRSGCCTCCTASRRCRSRAGRCCRRARCAAPSSCAT